MNNNSFIIKIVIKLLKTFLSHSEAIKKLTQLSTTFVKTPKPSSELKLVKLRQQVTCFAQRQQNRSSVAVSPWGNLFYSFPQIL